MLKTSVVDIPGYRTWILSGISFVLAICAALYYFTNTGAEPEKPEHRKPDGGSENASPAAHPSESSQGDPHHSDASAVAAEKFTWFAKQSNLQVFDSSTLSLNPGCAELLGLSFEDRLAVELRLKEFMDRLKAAELAQAFVSVTPNGDETIIVPAFDRHNIIERLRTDVSKAVNPDVGDFLANRIGFDMPAATANEVMSLGIETGDDGAERVVVSFSVLRRDAVDAKTPIVDGHVNFSPLGRIHTKSLLGSGFDPRFKHLFQAAKTLPRVEEK